MISYNATLDNLNQALSEASREFGGNLKWKREPERLAKNGDTYRFTITVKNSRDPGARRSMLSNRRIAAACWHAHGTFFDKLFAICPDARVSTGIQDSDGKYITATKQHHWIDAPADQHGRLWLSDLCLCNEAMDKEAVEYLEANPHSGKRYVAQQV